MMPDKTDLIYDIVKDLKEEQKKLRLENKEEHIEIRDQISNVNYDVGKLKVKSSVWGAIAAAIPVSIGAIWLYIKSKFGS